MKTLLHRLAGLLVCAAVIVGVASCSKTEPPAAPSAAGGVASAVAKADPKQETITRGLYLATAGDCYACHTLRGQPPYAGGLEIPTPFGKLYTPNITPDLETGIGSWSADDFWRAMHDGRSKDGTFLYPAFPYTNYTKVTREDSDAIYAYFMSITAVKQKSRPHEMGFPYNQRELLAGWRTLYFSAGEFKDDPKQSKEWNRGAYLVEGLGHCNACHSARNMLGAVSKDDVSGGLIPVQNWYAPSLTSSAEAGVAAWETQHIVDLLKTGTASPQGTLVSVAGPMSEVVLGSTQHLSDADLRAMANYLKALPPSAADERSASVAETETETAAAATAAADPTPAPADGPGAKLYARHCAACHGDEGEGVAGIYPALAGNRAVLLRTPANLVHVVLEGGFAPATAGNPRPFGMPPFATELRDEQLAQVLTHIRGNWGNRAAAVSALEVGRYRGWR